MKILLVVIIAFVLMVALAWLFGKAALLNDMQVCRACGAPRRSEDCVWEGGAPFCSHGCALEAEAR